MATEGRPSWLGRWDRGDTVKLVPEIPLARRIRVYLSAEVHPN